MANHKAADKARAHAARMRRLATDNVGVRQWAWMVETATLLEQTADAADRNYTAGALTAVGACFVAAVIVTLTGQTVSLYAIAIGAGIAAVGDHYVSKRISRRAALSTPTVSEAA